METRVLSESSSGDPSPVSTASSTKKAHKRYNWQHPVEFVFCIFANTTLLLNFPYIMYRNGGAVFLIPYIFYSVLLGVPLSLLETYIGQKSQSGFISCFDQFTPILKAVGVTILVTMVVDLVLYHVLLAWAGYFLVGGFLGVQQVSGSCANYWNTPGCMTPIANQTNFTQVPGLLYNTPEQEYFHSVVLGLTGSIEDFGGVNIMVLASHCASWVLVFLACIMGSRSIGKVVPITFLLQIVLLFTLLGRALSLPGSSDGLLFLYTPNWSKIVDPDFWYSGFITAFFSVAPNFGSLIMLGSYNKPKHCFVYVSAVPILQIVLSVVSATMLFAFFGFGARMTDRPVEDVIVSGMDVVTIALPNIIKYLPSSGSWHAILFLAVFFPRFNHEVIAFQACVSAITDWFRLKFIFEKLVSLILLIVCCGLGIIFHMGNGFYILTIFDMYFWLFTPFVLILLISIFVTWVYGFWRSAKDFDYMFGLRCLAYVFIPLWGLLLPLSMIGLIFGSVAKNISPQTIWAGNYQFPDWTPVLGWLIALSPLMVLFVCLIIWFVASLVTKNPLALCKPETEPRVEQPLSQQFILDDIKSESATF